MTSIAEAASARDALARWDAAIAEPYWRAVRERQSDAAIELAWEKVRAVAPWTVPAHPFGWWTWTAV